MRRLIAQLNDTITSVIGQTAGGDIVNVRVALPLRAHSTARSLLARAGGRMPMPGTTGLLKKCYLSTFLSRPVWLRERPRLGAVLS